MSLSRVRGRSSGGLGDGETIEVLLRVAKAKRQRVGSNLGPETTDLLPATRGLVPIRRMRISNQLNERRRSIPLLRRYEVNSDAGFASALNVHPNGASPAISLAASKNT